MSVEDVTVMSCAICSSVFVHHKKKKKTSCYKVKVNIAVGKSPEVLHVHDEKWKERSEVHRTRQLRLHY